MSKTFERGCLIGSIVAMVLAYNTHYFVKGLFYILMAIGITLAFLVIKSLCSSRKDLKNIANICFWIAVSNLIDEIFFDPTAFGINEYLFAAVIIIWQWKFRKK